VEEIQRELVKTGGVKGSLHEGGSMSTLSGRGGQVLNFERYFPAVSGAIRRTHYLDRCRPFLQDQSTG